MLMENVSSLIALRQAATNPENRSMHLNDWSGEKLRRGSTTRSRSSNRQTEMVIGLIMNLFSDQIAAVIWIVWAIGTYLGEDVTEAVDHCSSLFPRRATTSDQRCWKDRWVRGKTYYQRANCSGTAYGLERPWENCAFDLGGGTFDILDPELDQVVAQVKATNGDTFLGGEDHRHQLPAQFELNMVLIYVSQNLQWLIKEEAEKAKKISSTRNHHRYLHRSRTKQSALHMESTLTRSHLLYGNGLNWPTYCSPWGLLEDAGLLPDRSMKFFSLVNDKNAKSERKSRWNLQNEAPFWYQSRRGSLKLPLFRHLFSKER